MTTDERNCDGAAAEAIEAVSGEGHHGDEQHIDDSRGTTGVGNTVVVVEMGCAASSFPPASAPSKTSSRRSAASDLGAILREPGREDHDVEMELDGNEKRRGSEKQQQHSQPSAGRRESAATSSTSFASVAEESHSKEDKDDHHHVHAPQRHSSRSFLFDGALVDEAKLLADAKSPVMIMSDEESVTSVTSSAGGSIVETAAAAAISASIEECVEHGEDGLTCVNPGSNGRCRHSLYGSPLPATEVLVRMGPEWAAAAVGRAHGGPGGGGSDSMPPVGAGSGGGMMDGGGGLIWTVRIVPDDYNEGGKLRYLSARDFDAENGRIKPRRGPKLPVVATDFFSSLVRIEGKKAVNMDAAAAAARRNRVSADGEGNEKQTRGEEGLWGMWDGGDASGNDTSEHSSGDSFFRDEHGANRLDILPSVDDIPLIGHRLALYLQSQSKAPPPCRYVFSGVLNSWPGLTTLEVLEIKCRGKIPRWSTRWSHDVHGRAGLAPSFPEEMQEVRATLRAPPWSAHGWSQSSPGFVFWHEPEECRHPAGAGARLRYGTDIVAQVERDRNAGVPAPRCRRVHMVNHRYARGSAKKESSKDRLTYHSVILLEWDHGLFCTVVEGAFLNGIGGYAGRSNWCYDEAPGVTTAGLYRSLPPEMVMPWKTHLSEIRCIDVPARNLDEFKSFVAHHEGHDKRFVDPSYTFSHDVRLTFRSKDHIATYLLNYIRRDRTYSEIKRNCQTLAADLGGFLAGKKDVQPFHPVNQMRYTCRKHYFLYESDMYA